MTTTRFFRLAAVGFLGLALLAPQGAAKPTPPAPEPLGNHTYQLTRKARFAFNFNTDKLKETAREDAAKFCAGLGRRMQVVSITADKASLVHGGFSSATIVFRALEPGDPALAATAAPGLSDQQMLDYLHARRVLTDEEYAAAKSRLDGRSAELDQLNELRRKGVLTDTEYEAAKGRLLQRAP